MADVKVIRQAWETAQHSNRKPPDELADIREKVKALKEREEVLRSQMITGGVDLVGDSFRVVVVRKNCQRIDTAKIKKELGLKFLQPFMITAETIYVNVYPKKTIANG
jgi:hypothetical protein